MWKRDIAPAEVIDSLLANGWQIVGQGPAHKRLAIAGQRHTLMVPLDRSAPEFKQIMSAALEQVEELARDGNKAAGALSQILACR